MDVAVYHRWGEGTEHTVSPKLRQENLRIYPFVVKWERPCALEGCSEVLVGRVSSTRMKKDGQLPGSQGRR